MLWSKRSHFQELGSLIQWKPCTHEPQTCSATIHSEKHEYEIEMALDSRGPINNNKSTDKTKSINTIPCYRSFSVSFYIYIYRFFSLDVYSSFFFQTKTIEPSRAKKEWNNNTHTHTHNRNKQFFSSTWLFGFFSVSFFLAHSRCPYTWCIVCLQVVFVHLCSFWLLLFTRRLQQVILILIMNYSCLLLLLLLFPYSKWFELKMLSVELDLFMRGAWDMVPMVDLKIDFR